MKKRQAMSTIMVLGIIAIQSSLVGCVNKKTNEKASDNANDNANDYTEITAKEAIKMMKKEEDYVILDVRTQEEFEFIHIPDAICIPNEVIGKDQPKELPDKEQTILVYCRSGNRSKQASSKLANLGYTNVYEFGGIHEWLYEKD